MKKTFLLIFFGLFLLSFNAYSSEKLKLKELGYSCKEIESQK